MQSSPTLIQNQQQIRNQFIKYEKMCIMIQNYQDPGLKPLEIIQKMIEIENSIKQLKIFSPNQHLKEIYTQNLKLLVLPYHIGYLFGKISQSRKQSINQSRNYLKAYVQLCLHFNSQQQQIFPQHIYKIWKKFKQIQNFKIQRDQLITSQKQKRLIRNRYQNSLKIKQQSDQRQSIKDFIALHIYQAITQLKMIQQEIKILQYKDSLKNDLELQAKHQEQLQKPIPKMKIWNIRKPQQIQQSMLSSCPHHGPQNQLFTKKQEVIAQVWQQNPNKPTISLQQVADMQIQNTMKRTQREKKYQQANKEDTDSDKEDVDARKKKKARQWDDWKDQNQKGAGNRNNR